VAGPSKVMRRGPPGPHHLGRRRAGLPDGSCRCGDHPAALAGGL